MAQSINELVANAAEQTDDWSGYNGTERTNGLVFLSVVIHNCVSLHPRLP